MSISNSLNQAHHQNINLLLDQLKSVIVDSPIALEKSDRRANETLHNGVNSHKPNKKYHLAQPDAPPGHPQSWTPRDSRTVRVVFLKCSRFRKNKNYGGH
jgi:hypothetical protein